MKRLAGLAALLATSIISLATSVVPLATSVVPLATCAALIAGCAGTPAYVAADCPFYDELGPVRANPAGALDRHLVVEVSFRVCPPGEGLAEIRRKRIELRHAVLSLLSSKSEAELSDPLRVEKLQKELLAIANRQVMRKGRVTDVRITGFELQ